MTHSTAVVARPDLTLELLPDRFAIVRLQPHTAVPTWAQDGSLVSVTRTAEELSIVCPESSVPADVRSERGFRCLRVLGPIAFGEIGILESLAQPLARARVSIFAISTYDTDYLLFAEASLEVALHALSGAGHVVRRLGTV